MHTEINPSAIKDDSVSLDIEAITIRHLDLPLKVPYHLSYRTFESFEPFLVEITAANGRQGWGDGHISPGSSSETREGGWEFYKEVVPALIGLSAGAAQRYLSERLQQSKVACSTLLLALETLQESPLTEVREERSLPLLTPVNAIEQSELEQEIEDKLGEGFRTFKIKVGKDAGADIKRVATIQSIVGQRATLRIDANRGYSEDEGILFASSISPENIELFEQPCPAEDWEANAAVAKASNVPLMLDEPICSLADIEKAASIEGVQLCKLKLKRFGSMAELYTGLNRVRELGMEAVLGDGLGSELTSWMEACVAQTTIRNAGEFNGFLKPTSRLFKNPLVFQNGNLLLPKGYKPVIDPQIIESSTVHSMTYER